MKLAVTILGTRGSVPVSGSAYSRYGGATTCVLVQSGLDVVVLDAGTGMLALPDEMLSRPVLPLLLSHPHADHLLGLPICPYIMNSNSRLNVYGKTRFGLNVREQVRSFLSPPLWPVGPDELPADVCFHDLPQTLRFGAITVEEEEGIHPGGVSLFRLSVGGKRVVFMTDCSLDKAILPRLTAFAQDCDLLLLDGQYSDEEMACFAGFGHSSWNEAARFADSCGAKQLRIIHHAPFRTDAQLDGITPLLHEINPAYDFAKEGEKIVL